MARPSQFPSNIWLFHVISCNHVINISNFAIPSTYNIKNHISRYLTNQLQYVTHPKSGYRLSAINAGLPPKSRKNHSSEVAGYKIIPPSEARPNFTGPLHAARGQRSRWQVRSGLAMPQGNEGVFFLTGTATRGKKL